MDNEEQFSKIIGHLLNNLRYDVHCQFWGVDKRLFVLLFATFDK